MGLEGLFISLAAAAFTFILGWLKGVEDEQRRIREAFRSEDYNYEGFFDVLEKHEQEKEAAKYWAKHNKKRKK